MVTSISEPLRVPQTKSGSGSVSFGVPGMVVGGLMDEDKDSGSPAGEAVLSTGNDSRVPLVAAVEVLEAGINWGVTVGYALKVVAAELEEKGQATAVMFVVVPVLGLEDEFWHLLRRPGRQLSQILPFFAQEQFLQLPVLLQRQHVIFHRSLGLDSLQILRMRT